MLRDVSLQIRHGTSVGIIGVTGAGKTTLVDLILGLLRPDSGAVCYGALDIYEDYTQWQKHIGYIPQNIYLVDDTIRSNVALGLDPSEIDDRQVWRALEDAHAAGKVRVIGVSNFLQDDLENLLSDCRVKPMVNQILLHISNTDLALLDYCREQGIHVEAYSPIAHGEALKNPAIAEMAKKYGVNAAQLCIRYVIELGAVALPKTANPDHMASNAAVDFTILSEDMETLKHTDRIADYGEFNIFPVFSGKPLA